MLRKMIVVALDETSERSLTDLLLREKNAVEWSWRIETDDDKIRIALVMGGDENGCQRLLGYLWELPVMVREVVVIQSYGRGNLPSKIAQAIAGRGIRVTFCRTISGNVPMEQTTVIETDDNDKLLELLRASRNFTWLDPAAAGHDRPGAWTT